MKIIADSGLDFNQEAFEGKSPIVRVPLKALIDGEQFVDEGSTISDFLQEKNFKTEKVQTACPSPMDYYNAIKGADDAFVVTLSSNLSGSYQAAKNAHDMIIEETPSANVHVFDSKSAASGENLIVVKIQELIGQNLSFDTIVEKTTEYISGLKTIFFLENLDLMTSSGRVSIAQKFLSKTLKLFPILEDNGNGEIKMHSFARGAGNALDKLINSIGEFGSSFHDKILGITHVNAPDKAQYVKSQAEKKYDFKDIIIFEAGGISTIFGDNQGVILAF